ncbi:MAG: TonB-dependent receptor [Paraglaciecola sp.]|uniref:TonB-dependent receptor n=1 Tax=Paraglaciecola sp. TaxID=1920173 RepID=UPI00273EAEA6|nr:TonB-dependent receptor [Paraglaciecola sp.]MDP5029772.1 TonB-dependent receptor [Paraglaciecola sp.]MDP5130535.1 TonB-dependent receptor [Paraglaciecola sp.]
MGHKLSKITLAMLSATTLNFVTPVFAQVAQSEPDDDTEIIEVSGIRASLTNALAEKRSASSLVEIIQAEDIGKLPDQNLAEVLENITGVQITRSAGVGTGVQIRGTDANRTEINGVSTVGSGAGRSGINFEDVSASIIAGLEVTKAPVAKTIEGSVGGTINLRTIRPLELSETLASVRVQAEDSSLSTDGATPRLSGTFGDNWETDHGEFGVVFSASYAEQDVTAFRPRADRDNIVRSDSGLASAQSFSYLPIQFLIQDYDNYEYETVNFAGSFEWAPNSNTKFWFDAIVNDQDRREESSRVQASGVSDLRGVSIPTEFETVDFGSLDGVDLGDIQAAVKGVIPVDSDGLDPNLRLSSDTSSRKTKSKIFRLGGEYYGDNYKISAEASSSTSDSSTPRIDTTLNFLNPNATIGSANDNGTPFEYDLSGGSLAFGIAYDAANAPTRADLLNPANYRLQAVAIAQNTNENTEDAMRFDVTYDLNLSIFTTIDAGYRYNKTSSVSNVIGSNLSISSLADSPDGSLFSDILTTGPDNFNAADGRELFVKDFLLVDPEIVASDPDRVFETLASAITTYGGSRQLSQPTSSVAGFYDISESTNALYAQANFESGIFRGNVGLRYVKTDLDSTGTRSVNGDTVAETTSSDYSFVLPRINVSADVTDDVVLRAAWGKDIRRPNFSDLSSSYTFSTSPNPAVSGGNPNLKPELVTSFDISAEWYFAEAALVSIGYFHKTREDVHVGQQVDPYSEPGTGYRDIVGPVCEQGGIWNPIALINVFGPVSSDTGVCVPFSSVINDTKDTTQKGIEMAFQYDLSAFESDLGWASGFGVVANYTIQEFSGGEAFNTSSSRASQVFAASTGSSDTSVTVTAVQGLLNLSENAYNFTLYYEKFGLSARMRYTWREAFRSDDFGSTSSYPWGFPVIQEDRGQLNASISYDVNEQLNIGIEGVNLTESEITQSCVNEGALLCFQGLTDRRITVGASYRF